MKNNKILIVINNLGVGGAERVVVDDINEMIRRGFEINLITLRPEFQRSLESQCDVLPKNKILINFNGFFDFKSYIIFFKFIKNTNPNLIISHLWFANTISRVTCIFSGYKNIICFEQNVYDLVKTKKMFFVDSILQFFCRKVIAVSETVKKSLIDNGIQEKRIHVIYNSIDLKKYDSAPSMRNLFKDVNNFIFLFVGRLIPQKGVDVLINAFEKVENATLMIAGQGPEKDNLEKIIKNKNIGNKIVFLGVCDSIPSLLASVDCFVFPSRHEGFPLVLLEAMASQLPIIITDFPSGLEVVKHGLNGLVSPIDDVEKLSFAMNDLMHSEELQKKLAIQARKDVCNFSIQNHVNIMLTFL